MVPAADTKSSVAVVFKETDDEPLPGLFFRSCDDRVPEGIDVSPAKNSASAPDAGDKGGCVASGPSSACCCCSVLCVDDVCLSNIVARIKENCFSCRQKN